MTAAEALAAATPESRLAGATVVVIGGSAGIGLETARQARGHGAEVILVGRDEDRLRRAAAEVGAMSTASFDATDAARIERFFAGLPAAVDHVMVTAGRPLYGRLGDLDLAEVSRHVAAHVVLPLAVGRAAAARMTAAGTLLFMSGTGGRRPGPGRTVIGALTAALPALVANLAVELAPIRVNLIAAGFVDTPLSAELLGDDLDDRRDQLRATLPIGRVVTAADVAALAVHLMTNTALTGATYDIDGGQHLVSA
jgi:NAD(P)-dependent dehydrogenase (short-subunit alcohol dehydrogenase family)